MADKSKIEWTDASWTPIRALNPANGKIGWHCEHATTGCEFCYAESMNKRLGTGLPFKPGHRKELTIFLDEQMLTAPLRWKKPRRVFVCSMTDLFADFVKDEWIDKIFAVMALCPQHTFQVLTKRAERMREYVAQRYSRNEVELAAEHIKPSVGRPVSPKWCFDWPLPNVWLGVSCERQQEADERIPHLLNTPAAVRFASCEPLLGPIDLTPYLYTYTHSDMAALECGCSDEPLPFHENPAPKDVATPRLDWVIAGGESGRGARPAHVDWVRSLCDQCEAADVAFFMKQWGEYRPCAEAELKTACGAVLVGQSACGAYMLRVGKKRAGRLLDGREHNEFPQVSA